MLGKGTLQSRAKIIEDVMKSTKHRNALCVHVNSRKKKHVVKENIRDLKIKINVRVRKSVRHRNTISAKNMRKNISDGKMNVNVKESARRYSLTITQKK